MAKFGIVLTFLSQALDGLVYPTDPETPEVLVFVLNGHRVNLRECSDA